MPAASPSAPTGAPRLVRYGLVPMAALVMLATLPGRTHGLGLITEPLLEEVRVDRLTFAQVNLWATLIGALFCVPIGGLIDRFGVRPVTVAMLVATGASAWALGLTSGAFVSLLLVVTLTRGFGQSALSVCSITAVGKWHARRPGPAMGLFAFLMGLFFAVAFGVVGWSVREHGWRAAWTGIAASLVVVLAPLALLVLREPPRAEPGDRDAAAAGTGTSFAEALRTPTFWIFAGGTALFGLVSSGLGLFQQAVLAERGFDQKTYHTLLVVTTFITLFAQLGAGWLSPRVGLARVCGAGLACYAAALVWLPFVAGPVALWGFATLIGVSAGMVIVVFFAVWSQAFGRLHLGRIQAAAQGVTVIASAVGPLLFARVQAATGSYSPVLLALAPAVLLLAVASWRTQLPGTSEPRRAG